MILLILRFLRFIKSILVSPKIRVRKIDMETGYYVWGTVEKEEHHWLPLANQPRTYWTVVWDDAPGVWLTVSSYSFLWHDGTWTLIQR